MKDMNLQNCQYNSCTSRGICSVNPKTASLQNVLILYLYLISEYCLKLYQKEAVDNETIEMILECITATVSIPEFSEEIFWQNINKLKNLLPQLINKYNEIYEKADFTEEDIFSSDIFKRSKNIVDAINLGEELAKKFSDKFSSTIRDLYKLILVIAKSISLNMLDLKSFEPTDNDGFLKVVEILSLINSGTDDVNKLKEELIKASETNYCLIKKLHQMHENKYGKQEITTVSYTTVPASAVLVVGYNIKELEIILEALKNTNIDVYTHGDMILAHTFPKFKKYEALKGQYGYGVENCLVDFSTFPGPIILTKHSLHNIENLYRGRLYTTDENFSKGVIKINNYDLTDVISTAYKMKGFKKGKICEVSLVGYDYKKVDEDIRNALDSDKYKRVFVFGESKFCEPQKRYFEKLINIADEETLIISSSRSSDKNNLIHINSCYDPFGIIRIVDLLKDSKISINIFFPKCNRNTVAECIYISNVLKFNVFIGECAPIMLNPSIKRLLNETFSIIPMTTPKADMEKILLQEF
ncbi:MAG: hypothetical protein MJ237_01445 [bacterium]|nr:hypothetical protein [bacterium]